VLWDINRTWHYRSCGKGSDMPGRITRLPGGVPDIAMGAGPLWLVPCACQCCGRDPRRRRAYGRVQIPGASLRIMCIGRMICPLTAIWREGNVTV